VRTAPPLLELLAELENAKAEAKKQQDNAAKEENEVAENQRKERQDACVGIWIGLNKIDQICRLAEKIRNQAKEARRLQDEADLLELNEAEKLRLAEYTSRTEMNVQADATNRLLKEEYEQAFEVSFSIATIRVFI
jgi:hypothetical protein